MKHKYVLRHSPRLLKKNMFYHFTRLSEKLQLKELKLKFGKSNNRTAPRRSMYAITPVT